jgi:hypothetical protein
VPMDDQDVPNGGERCWPLRRQAFATIGHFMMGSSLCRLPFFELFRSIHSQIAGTSGRISERTVVVTASGRSVPDLQYSIAAGNKPK